MHLLEYGQVSRCARGSQAWKRDSSKAQERLSEIQKTWQCEAVQCSAAGAKDVFKAASRQAMSAR